MFCNTKIKINIVMDVSGLYNNYFALYMAGFMVLSHAALF